MVFKNGAEKISELFKKTKFSKYLIPIAGIVITNWEAYDFFKTLGKVNSKLVVFSLIINLVIIYLCAVIKNKDKEIANINEERMVLAQKNNALTELNDNIRSFKHDFYNILQAIDGYILLNDMESLKKYFSKLLKESNYVKNLEIITTSSIKDPAIYGVLLNKCKIAEKKDIEMNIDVLMNFEKMDEKSYELSRILGILLDNAIEASVDCENKLINVQFREGTKKDTKRIIIENTYKEKDIDTKKIFEKNFSTKKENGNSGIGLWKVKEIIDKESEILLETSKDSNLFKQELEICI